MPPCEKCQFFDQYTEAIEASESPEISEIRELVINVLENPNRLPAYPMHWPLHTFIAASLERNVPLNWLTEPPLEEMEIYNMAIGFYENLLKNGNVLVCNEDDEPVEYSESLMRAIKPQAIHVIINVIEKSGNTDFLEQVEHVHVQIDNGQVTGIRPCPKKGVVEKLMKNMFGQS